MKFKNLSLFKHKFILTVLFVLLTVMIAFSLYPVEKAYAAENNAAGISYNGSFYYCRYNLKIGSQTITYNKYNYDDFQIYMEGQCWRKNRKNYVYNLTLTIKNFADNEVICTKKYEKSVNSDPNNDITVLFDKNSISKKGKYILEYSGTVSRRRWTENYSGAYCFEII